MRTETRDIHFRFSKARIPRRKKITGDGIVIIWFHHTCVLVPGSGLMKVLAKLSACLHVNYARTIDQAHFGKEIHYSGLAIHADYVIHGSEFA